MRVTQKKRQIILSVVLYCLFHAGAIAQNPPIIKAETLPFNTSNPFIWDNDANTDVFTLEFVMVLANNKTINLVGISESPHPYRTQSEDLQEVVLKARNSGLKNIPDAAWDLGNYYMTAIKRPESGNIDDTKALNTAPARMIRDKVLQAGSESKPVVIGCGGALTTVASAYLLAKEAGRAAEFSSKVILCANNGEMANGLPSTSSYNTFQDSWAAYICLTRLKMVIAGGILDGCPKIWDFIDTLPDNELTQYMRWKKGPQWPYPDLHADGDAMCVLAFILPTQGDYFTGTTRVSFDDWSEWKSEWGHPGPKSINLNAYMKDMKIKTNANSEIFFITGYNQSVAEKVWEDAFSTVFSKLKK